MRANCRSLRRLWIVAMAMGLAGGVAYVGFCQGPAEHARSAVIESDYVLAPANGSVADQLAAVEKAVSALTLTAAPTSAQAGAVEAALTRMVQISTSDSQAVGPLHDATVEQRTHLIAYRLSQVLRFMFEQQNVLVKAAYPQQATAR